MVIPSSVRTRLMCSTRFLSFCMSSRVVSFFPVMRFFNREICTLNFSIFMSHESSSSGSERKRSVWPVGAVSKMMRSNSGDSTYERSLSNASASSRPGKRRSSGETSRSSIPMSLSGLSSPVLKSGMNSLSSISGLISMA